MGVTELADEMEMSKALCTSTYRRWADNYVKNEDGRVRARI